MVPISQSYGCWVAPFPDAGGASRHNATIKNRCGSQRWYLCSLDDCCERNRDVFRGLSNGNAGQIYRLGLGRLSSAEHRPRHQQYRYETRSHYTRSHCIFSFPSLRDIAIGMAWAPNTVHTELVSAEQGPLRY